MTKEALAWIIDDDQSIRWVLEKALQHTSIRIESYAEAESPLRNLRFREPQVIITDIRMPGLDGLDFLEKVKQRYPHIPVIIMTAHSDLDSAVSAYQGGAFEYLPKPFDIDEAVHLIQRAIQRNQTTQTKNIPSHLIQNTPEIIGEAPAMQEVFRAIGRLSQSNITVLINGQSGTGKELVAKALHKHSPRANQSFIALNMAAIPKDLIESELFGHEKGAFTGAQFFRQGRFEQAHQGTLFLDEIGDMPLEAQTRLLRVLQEGEFYRVGGQQPIKIDVRFIAATHQNLERLVQLGTFREDLFHRLNVIRIHLPALNERRKDIKNLAKYFLEKAAQELKVPAKALTLEAEKFLTSADWKGNVRQLENTCRWLTVMASGHEIMATDMPVELRQQPAAPEQSNQVSWDLLLKQWASQALDQNKRNILHTAVPMFEKTLIEVALNYTSGRRRDAAELLGWGRNTLTRKMKELNMHPDFIDVEEESLDTN